MSTVSVEVPETRHAGDGASTHFLIGFELADPAHLRVEVDGVAKTNPAHYTVVADEVVWGVAPADDADIVHWRVTPVQQTTEFQSQPTMKPLSVERALNERALVDQEVKARADRAMVAPIGEQGLTLPRDVLRAGTVFVWDEDGKVRTDLTIADFAQATADIITAPALANIAAREAQALAAVDAKLVETLEDIDYQEALSINAVIAQQALSITAVQGQQTLSVAAVVTQQNTSVTAVSNAGAAQIAAIGAMGITNFFGDVLPIEQLHSAPHRTRSPRQALRQLDRGPSHTALRAALPLEFGKRWNLWGRTEDISTGTSSYYGVTNATKGTDQITVDGITLTRVTSGNFYGQLSSNVGGNGLTPFVTGDRYFISYYVLSVSGERPFWTRSLATNGVPGHGPRLATNQMRRVWTLAQALSTSTLDLGADGTVALGAGASGGLIWFFNGAPAETGGNLDFFIGGLQVESVGDNAYKDGVCIIGDSNAQGASGLIDLMAAREWAFWLACALNAPTFNRGVGGYKLIDADTNFAASYAPLAASCGHALTALGTNDLPNTLLADMQTQAASIHTKAVAAFGRHTFLTVPPVGRPSSSDAQEVKRLAFNAWLIATYPGTIDIASFLADPANPLALRQDADWKGDGIHYGPKAKRALGFWLAGQLQHEFKVPGPYQKNTAAQTSFTPQVEAVSGVDGILLSASAASGWGLQTGTAERTTMATFTKNASAIAPGAAYVQSEAVSVANRLQALEQVVQDISRRQKGLIDDLHVSNAGTAGKHGLLKA